MIDTHCHLFDEEFDIDREDAIKRAIDSGVEKMILVGFSHKTNQLAQEMAKKWNVFYPTAGLHPSEASLNYLNDFLEFKSFVEKNKVYAVGECGLDYHWDITYKEEQKKLFRLQCEYAIKKDLPIVVHSRDAAQDTYDHNRHSTGPFEHPRYIEEIIQENHQKFHTEYFYNRWKDDFPHQPYTESP